MARPLIEELFFRLHLSILEFLHYVWAGNKLFTLESRIFYYYITWICWRFSLSLKQCKVWKNIFVYDFQVLHSLRFVILKKLNNCLFSEPCNKSYKAGENSASSEWISKWKRQGKSFNNVQYGFQAQLYTKDRAMNET